MTKERAILDLNDDDVDILDVANKTITKRKVDLNEIKQVANQSGFVSRQAIENTSASLPKRRRRSSPYTTQLGIRIRPDMKDLFQDLSDQLYLNDCTTFERAILALCEKEGFDGLIERYHTIAKIK